MLQALIFQGMLRARAIVHFKQRRFLNDAGLPPVNVLPSSTVVLPIFLTNRLYNTKDT